MDKYYHDDNFEFRGIRNIQDLFKSSIGEDYYKPTLVKSGYNSNYIHNTRKVHLAYKSKHNLTREKHVILLMITDGKKWHDTAVKRLSGLFREVTGNNNGDFYCLNCFHAYTTENKLEKHKKICENHDYCHVDIRRSELKELDYRLKLEKIHRVI